MLSLTNPKIMHTQKNAAFSGKTFIVYFAPLIVFPIAGYALGVFRSVLAFEDRFIIFKMSLASITALFACVITWLCFSGILGMVFFSSRFDGCSYVGTALSNDSNLGEFP
ncbi:hypothetical protein JCM18909_3739 [Cutibacterium acnes JCM 18909]|nr:hypothetical protein JCM18909_3739 [Cutibacterium acnes JCM 18909]